MTHTAEPMTLESVRDFHRKLATEHKVIPPLSDAHAAMADAIDAELAKQREAEPVAFRHITPEGKPNCVGWRDYTESAASLPESMKKDGWSTELAYDHPQQRKAVGVAHEREAFEKWCVEAYGDNYQNSFPCRNDGTYQNGLIRDLWKAWFARSALQSAPAPINAIAQLVSELPSPKTKADYHAPMGSSQYGHMKGWNDCLEAMLSAAPKREGE